MTSIGRGRGWSRPAETENVLRRPGQPSSPKASEFDELVDRIHNDLRIEETPQLDKVKDLVTLVNTISESQSFENVLEKVWKQALDDHSFGIKILKLYGKEYWKCLNSGIVVASEMKRGVWQKMQDYYEKKDEWRKENPSHLTSLVWMLGYAAESSSSIILYRTMGLAMIKCCSLLLESGTEEDAETVAIQMLINGKGMDTELSIPFEQLRRPDLCDPTDAAVLRELVNQARTILVNRNVSTRTRALLLLIIDLANQHYEPLTGDLQTFYVSTLGRGRPQDNDSQIRSAREFNTGVYLYNILTKDGKLPKNKKAGSPAVVQVQETPRTDLPPPQIQKVNRGPNGGGPGPIPRAIRGSGASEIPKEHRNDKRSPRGHKEKLTDKQVWSSKQNTGSKVWGHDDRFDNDYE